MCVISKYAASPPLQTFRHTASDHTTVTQGFGPRGNSGAYLLLHFQSSPKKHTLGAQERFTWTDTHLSFLIWAGDLTSASVQCLLKGAVPDGESQGELSNIPEERNVPIFTSDPLYSGNWNAWYPFMHHRYVQNKIQDPSECSGDRVVSTSVSHQCGQGSIPGWGSDPCTVSEKGFVSVWATLHPWVGTLNLAVFQPSLTQYKGL